MTRVLAPSCSFVLAFALLGCGSEPATPPVDGVSGHELVAIDNGKNQLVRIDARGDIVWTAPLPAGPRDVQRLDADRVLVSFGAGAAEYSLVDGAEGWKVDGYGDVQSAERLADGTTLLAEQLGDGVALRTLGADGAELGVVQVSGAKELRLARRLPNGHTLFTVEGPYRVVEVDAVGAQVWEAALPGKGYLALREADGSTLATTGDDCSVVRLDASGAQVARIGGKDRLPEAGLDWFSGFQPLKSGNLLTTNWLGHFKWGTGPQLVELDAESRIVWQWRNDEAVRQVTHVLVLEE
jgi:hypothetical protein